MKILLLVSMLFIASRITAYGQEVTANDLVTKSVCKTFECFNEFITNKGFSLRTTQKHSGGEVELFYTFNNDTKLTTNAPDNYLIISKKSTQIIFVAISSSINVITTDKNYYETLVNQFKHLGFGITDTGKLATGKLYSSSAYPILELWIPNNQSPDKKTGLTNYDIILQDKKKTTH